MIVMILLFPLLPRPKTRCIRVIRVPFLLVGTRQATGGLSHIQAIYF